RHRAAHHERLAARRHADLDRAPEVPGQHGAHRIRRVRGGRQPHVYLVDGQLLHSRAQYGSRVIAVVKIGTSSLTDEAGEVDRPSIEKVCAEVAEVRAAGHQVVLVTSGAIAAGLPALGFARRPGDLATLQAVSAVGQSRLMRVY